VQPLPPLGHAIGEATDRGPGLTRAPDGRLTELPKRTEPGKKAEIPGSLKAPLRMPELRMGEALTEDYRRKLERATMGAKKSENYRPAFVPLNLGKLELRGDENLKDRPKELEKIKEDKKAKDQAIAAVHAVITNARYTGTISLLEKVRLVNLHYIVNELKLVDAGTENDFLGELLALLKKKE
jgi:hypothetical protein